MGEYFKLLVTDFIERSEVGETIPPSNNVLDVWPYSFDLIALQHLWQPALQKNIWPSQVFVSNAERARRRVAQGDLAS